MTLKRPVILCLLFLQLAPAMAIAQASFSARVISAAGKQPIAFATIINTTNRRTGTYSDAAGYFTIPANKEDSLRVVALGFRDTVISVSSGIHEVTLSALAYVLPEVIVKAGLGSKERMIGFTRLPKDKAVFPGTRGGIIVVHVQDQASEGRLIAKLVYQLQAYSRLGDKVSDGMVRVRLYDRNEMTGEPDKNLLPEDILLKPVRKPHLLEVDISKYGILLPATGVFAGLEWLGEENNTLEININPGFSMSTQLFDPDSYVSFYGRKFNKAPATGGSYFVPMFGIVIK
jgi:hypothetical protein